MTPAALFSFLGYMLVCSFTPGPGNILALNTAGTYGWKQSRRLLLGICAGYAAVQTLCTVVLYQMNHYFAEALNILRFLGCGYMLWLALLILRSHPEEMHAARCPSFRTGFLMQLVNVKIYFYISSLLTVYFIPNCKTIPALAGAGAFAVAVGSTACVTWAAVGAALQKLYAAHYRTVNTILSVFLLYCAWSIVKG